MSMIRPATTADLDRLSELFDSYRVFYDQPSDPAAARDFLSTRLALADSRILVCEADGGLTGFVQLYPTLSSVRLGPRWTLADLFVAPQGRGKGVGRSLMKAAVRLAEEHGVGQLTLLTQTHNHTAQRLYEALGWQRNDAFFGYTLTLAPSSGA
ncbi:MULTISPECIES: GNAT family N-acetyltransferase [unclassified Halomonas]|uniref:GNAT family N-acetyltransferase n=1 Tax=unclassified Halomonas TaxID=2609666 RepID=UPI001C943689|nr:MULTISPECIES: GNAT family N-acetyltransferase [unclassified Halomonas]MBY5926978.1 GNAT family N-acetyltransferase [Halomonas sp. DP4Y7-2]MBY6234020.1 GNAT family N-acetyltransferase [Halomonas sp. DP4Y7-1]